MLLVVVVVVVLLLLYACAFLLLLLHDLKKATHQVSGIYNVGMSLETDIQNI